MSDNSAFETDSNSSAFETKNNSAFETNQGSSAFETKPEPENKSDSAFETNSNGSAFESETENSVPEAGSVFASASSESAIETESGISNPSVMDPAAEEPPKQDVIDSLTLVDHNGKELHLKSLHALSERGAMGEVYRASLEINGGASSRTVLFKRSNPSPSKEELQLFTNESALSCEMGGGNIIKGLYCGEHENRPFLITEFYEGESLRKKIEQDFYKNKYLESINVIYGILDGLMRLESNEMVHRDLKPANIIIRKDGNPVIIDLGLARQESFADLNLKKVGTEKYAAPEQMNGGHVGYYSDIYAVGLIFLEMLTGTTDLSEVRKLPDGIQSFIEKCCKDSPEGRFPNARAARAQLERVYKSVQDPKRQQELYEEEVARRFCDDLVISEAEVVVLQELASRYFVSQNIAREVVERICELIKQFREETLVGNILNGRPDNCEIDEIAEKLHVERYRVSQWKMELMSAMKMYAVAIRQSDESACQEILEKYPFLKNYRNEICSSSKFRVSLPRRSELHSKSAPAQNSSTPKSSRGKIFAIVGAVLFVVLCMALFPKDAYKSSGKTANNASAAKADVAETKTVEAVESKPANSEVQQSASFTKPADFDDSKEFFDSRDGRVYKLLNFAGKVWLVGNLSYTDKELSFARCYDNSRSCEEFGRLYDYGSAKKACPSGSRLPTQGEWEQVLKVVGAKGSIKLKSYDGFAALDAGYYQKAVDAYFYKGEIAGWWVGDSEENGNAKVFNMFRNDPLIISKENVNDAYSVRCVKE